jgi:hypothetical protein
MSEDKTFAGNSERPRDINITGLLIECVRVFDLSLQIFLLTEQDLLGFQTLFIVSISPDKIIGSLGIILHR